jgi:hypothetical protein
LGCRGYNQLMKYNDIIKTSIVSIIALDNSFYISFLFFYFYYFELIVFEVKVVGSLY